MDMQMPIVDGLTSTKMIRAFEKSQDPIHLSSRAALNGRVPIFAVSASLVERERQTYIEAGFDGWILKPVDFKRLNILLAGIVEIDTRKSAIYRPGEWERGGWLPSKNASPACSLNSSSCNISPTGDPSTELRGIFKANGDDTTQGGSQHSSESGSVTPGGDGQKRFFIDERLPEPVPAVAAEEKTDEEVLEAPNSSIDG